MAGHPGKHNLLLDRLLRYEPGLRAHVSPVEAAFGAELQAAAQPVRQIFFPTGGVVSMVVRLSTGAVAEVNAVGLEGLAGIEALLGLRRSPHTMLLQVRGPLLRVPTARLLEAQRSNHHVAALIRCFAAYALRFGQQSVACNALHAVSVRAVRWILSTADRTGSDEFLLTQELLALMLGASRQSVSQVVVGLRDEGLLDYTRGGLRLVDRARLEREACECYRIMRDGYEAVLGRPIRH